MDDQKEHDRIRRRAYEIWEREGSPEGRAEEFWERAETSIGAEDAQSADGGKAASGDTTAAQNESERDAGKQSGATSK